MRPLPSRAATLLTTLLAAASCERRPPPAAHVEPVITAQDATIARLEDAASSTDAASALDGASPADGASAASAMTFAIASGWIAESEREPNAPLEGVDAETRAQCTPVPSPRLPPVPAELAAQVERLRPLVRELRRCDNGGLRAPHSPDPRCDRWTDELVAQGRPAAWAAALELTEQPVVRRGNYRCGSNYGGAAAHRAAYVVAQHGELRLLPYLLRAIAIATPMYAQAMSGESVEFLWENVYRLALRSLGPATTNLYTEPDTALWRERLRRWGRWSLVFSQRDRDEWREAALAAQRPRLNAADERSSLIAAMILDQFESERPRVTAAIERACRRDREASDEPSPVWQSRLCWLRSNRFYDLPRDWEARARRNDRARAR
ncbi:MAG: hypothetical protein U0269_27325 [Polyangiales bacterium]